MSRGRRNLSRRRFLEGTGVLLGTSALGTTGCTKPAGAERGTAPATGGTPPDGAPDPPAGSGGAATDGEGGAATDAEGGAAASTDVAVVARADVDEAVALAVELAGGLDAIEPGQTVFIKPNAVSARAVEAPGIRTSPEVLAAVVRLVKERDPGHIVVGDRSARSFPDTARVFDVTGLAEAALAAGADEIYAAPSPEEAPDDWVLLSPHRYEETWEAAGGILAMRRILDADHLVNVPACKNHRYALFTMGMKNFVGAIGDASRDPLHFGQSIARNFEPMGRDIAVLNQLFSPLVTVLDAMVALVNGGPQGDGPDAVRTSPGLILAGKDRIALDATGVALLKRELGHAEVPQPDASHETLLSTPVWQLPQLRIAADLGLGVSGPEPVTLRFDGVTGATEIEDILRAGT